MSTNEPPVPPTPPGGGTPPPPPPPPPPSGGSYGGYGESTPPEPGAYGAPQQAGLPRPGELLDRFLARLIDGVIFAVVYVILSIILGAILISDGSINLETGEIDTGSTALYSVIFTLLVTALNLGYFAFMESSRGQTIGKMALKLKVVGPDGSSNPTLAQAAKRNVWLLLGLLGILGTFGNLLSFLGSVGAVILIVIGINDAPRRQTWFDKFAGELQVLKVG